MFVHTLLFQYLVLPVEKHFIVLESECALCVGTDTSVLVSSFHSPWECSCHRIDQYRTTPQEKPRV